MILEGETYEKFGYYPSDISHGSGKIIIAKCEDCGKIRETRMCGYRDFCPSCARKGKRNATWKPKIELICEYCGKSFMLLPCKIKAGKGAYCTNLCKYKAFEDRYKGEKNPHNKPKIQKTCKWCDGFFEVYPCHIGRIYCSVPCLVEAHTGEGHPNWKGGISFEPYCLRFNDKIKEKVRDYYGRQCFKCGKTEEENGECLCVHHVDFDKNQGCDNRKWELIPLCRSCHSWTNGNRVLSQAMFVEKLAQTGIPNF